MGIRDIGGGGIDPNEQSKVEDDTQPKMDNHPIITPLEQFFDNN